MKRIHAILLAALVLAVVVAVSVLRTEPATTSGSAGSGRIQVGGPFTLLDQDGRTVTDADFRGRIMLVFFGYTYCPDVCPTNLQAIAQALDMLDEAKRAKVAPVLISVDPERDTPVRLKEYVAAFHPALTGLTGTAEQVAVAAKAYKAYYAKVVEKDRPEDYLVDHSAITYIMGPDGAFIGHFGHNTPPEQIAERLRKLP